MYQLHSTTRNIFEVVGWSGKFLHCAVVVLSHGTSGELLGRDKGENKKKVKEYM